MSTVTKKLKKKETKKVNQAEVCKELQVLQRNRCVVLKSRIMMENRLVMAIATFLGYAATQDPIERKKNYKKAGEFIKQVMDGKVKEDSTNETIVRLIKSSKDGIAGFDFAVDEIEKVMVKLVKTLPIAEWAEEPSQRGFGLKSLAKLIGETGDLSNYPNPGKVWKRLGLAPFKNKKGEVNAPSTWRSGWGKSKLSAEEFVEMGYSPRRRSEAYLIGECLMKANKGIYRKRYDTVKNTALRNRDDWTECKQCEGTGRTMKKKTACKNCEGTGRVAMHCHKHAMLVMTKLLVKNLWMAWNPDLVVEQPW